MDKGGAKMSIEICQEVCSETKCNKGAYLCRRFRHLAEQEEGDQMLRLSKEEARELSVFLGYVANNHAWAFSGNKKVYVIMEKLDKALDEVEGKCQEESTEPVEQCQGCGESIYPGELVWIAGGYAFHRKSECLNKGTVPGEPVDEMYVEDWLERE